jgi:hypothetical protein
MKLPVRNFCIWPRALPAALDQAEPLPHPVTVTGDHGLPVAVLTPRAFNVRAGAGVPLA